MLSSYHIMIYSVSYVLFFALLVLGKKRNSNRLVSENGASTNRFMLITMHIGGGLLFTVPCVVFPNHRLIDIVFGEKAIGVPQVIVISIILIVVFIVSRRLAEKQYRLLYGQEAANIYFNAGFIVNYFIVRIMFLCFYEIWFRGYLLTDSMSYLGTPLAFISNIILYTFLHTVNGKKEMLVCIPFGFLLCILCAWTGAAWPAFIIHIALTASYETHLIRKINKPSISFI